MAALRGYEAFQMLNLGKRAVASRSITRAAVGSVRDLSARDASRNARSENKG